MAKTCRGLQKEIYYIENEMNVLRNSIGIWVTRLAVLLFHFFKHGKFLCHLFNVKHAHASRSDLCQVVCLKAFRNLDASKFFQDCFMERLLFRDWNVLGTFFVVSFIIIVLKESVLYVTMFLTTDRANSILPSFSSCLAVVSCRLKNPGRFFVLCQSASKQSSERICF